MPAPSDAAEAVPLALRELGPRTLGIELSGVKGNAISPPLLAALEQAVDGVVESACDVVIVYSARPSAFMVGGDLDVLAAWADTGELAANWADMTAQMGRTLDRLEHAPAISIAAIDGAAVGGGTELALACDFRVMGEAAAMALPEVALGVYPATGTVPRLARIVGRATALRLIVTGARVAAAEARALGIADELAGGQGALAAARALADELQQRDLAPVAAIKDELRDGWSVERSATAIHRLVDESPDNSGVRQGLERLRGATPRHDR